ncbi:hypothetical protein TMatcc_008336 [Talaromyces marneffei ATCC 18224]|uniref:Chromatin SPT2 n=1 Tax=Talaromyces marneffei (strain ATCC 18224 / CBS 334.59 / QM 7333) TaxID=441960 RepID=B6QMA0_TALMQ|nr:uncharacterized protein EYB26_007684 [Talaromyces marneffei]EEA22227.1 conserved hypothetical protein [Talaromyces marneffei ATCC 18224]KAE8550319.1 hypothetical protein EYB25_006545 [Talaromyces marneffei]QGA19984.1 hypothetical protein EYB26_007684 [Talaromyces marneffei]
MSFLSSVLSSIETGTPASLPPTTPRPSTSALSATVTKSEPRKSTPSAPTSNRPTSSNPSAGIKRKAEEPIRRPEKPSSTANGNDVKARPKAPLPVRPVVAKKPTPPAAPAKPPPKGSFADLMAKAKAVQKEAPKVGVLKHQAALPKEKISKSEMKRRMEAKAKGKEAARSGKQPGVSPAPNTGKKIEGKPGIDVSAKKREPEENTYKGTSRSAQPSYKGTANLPAKHKNAARRRAPRRDEYLGTDEEDEGDFYDDYDDYYSDASSDMEAGYGDMEREEYAALRAAQREDEEDIRMEAEAKRAKMERKQKLAALARAKR